MSFRELGEEDVGVEQHIISVFGKRVVVPAGAALIHTYRSCPSKFFRSDASARC